MVGGDVVAHLQNELCREGPVGCFSLRDRLDVRAALNSDEMCLLSERGELYKVIVYVEFKRNFNTGCHAEGGRVGENARYGRGRRRLRGDEINLSVPRATPC